MQGLLPRGRGGAFPLPPAPSAHVLQTGEHSPEGVAQGAVPGQSRLWTRPGDGTVLSATRGMGVREH